MIQSLVLLNSSLIILKICVIVSICCLPEQSQGYCVPRLIKLELGYRELFNCSNHLKENNAKLELTTSMFYVVTANTLKSRSTTSIKTRSFVKR